MKTKPLSDVPAEKSFTLSGTIRDPHQKPMAKAVVRIYNKGIRGKHLLGETVTDAAGKYSIAYTLKNVATAAIIVCVYDDHKTLLKESEVQYKVPVSLSIDLDLSGRAFAGISAYEKLMDQVAPFAEEVPLSKMTETDKEDHISFIVSKSGVSKRFPKWAVISLTTSSTIQSSSCVVRRTRSRLITTYARIAVAGWWIPRRA